MDEEGSKPDWNGIRRTYLKFSEAYNYFKDAFRILSAAFSVLIAVIVWLLRNIILQSLIGISCQSFYSATSNTQSICSILVRSVLSDDQKLFLKTVQRLNKANISKLDVYGLFIVDATLPLRLIQVIATYTIVLLQFAFQ
ncbi:uncharacterized protein LOC119628533 [Bombyx mori]|uniref:uncharacterized protein LOC119628533 n=1 Tax=Bombyx mori TaxID=7091 RepID=UPI002ED268F6